MLRCVRILSLIQGLFLPTILLANPLPLLSPYVDFTLNTYWDQQTQDLVPMDLHSIAAQQGIKSYQIAFITDSSHCEPAWGGQQAYSLQKQWGKKEIDQLHQQGVRVVASFGGANNNDISMNCDSNQLLHVYNNSINLYQLDGLDFDIENGSANVAKIIQALQVIQSQYPKLKFSFTLPVMPEGLTAEGKGIITAAKDAGLVFHVNIMAMDYGPTYSGDMGDYAMQAATSVHKFLASIYPNTQAQKLWQMIEVTPMIGVNDVNTEQFSLADADQLKQFAAKKQLGGLSFWSLNRDKPCADILANNHCSGNHLQTQDYEFIAHFQ